MVKHPDLPQTGIVTRARRLVWHVARVLAAGLFATAFVGSFAQTPTASRGLRVQVFGALSVGRTDYNPNELNLGATGGADVDVNVPFWLKPGFEVRATTLPGNSNSLDVFGGGPRVTLVLGRVQPYAYGLISRGNIQFNHATDAAYTHDNSIVYVLGGGVDVLLTKVLSLRFDAEGQHWRLSKRLPPFYPVSATVGVAYRFGNGRSVER